MDTETSDVIERISARIDALEESLRAAVRSESASLQDQLRTQIRTESASLRAESATLRDELRAEIRAESAAVKTELGDEIRTESAAVKTELRAEIRDGLAENRRHAEVLLHESPRLTEIHSRSAPDCCGVVMIASLVRLNGLGVSIG